MNDYVLISDPTQSITTDAFNALPAAAQALYRKNETVTTNARDPRTHVGFAPSIKQLTFKGKLENVSIDDVPKPLADALEASQPTIRDQWWVEGTVGSGDDLKKVSFASGSINAAYTGSPDDLWIVGDATPQLVPIAVTKTAVGWGFVVTKL